MGASVIAILCIVLPLILAAALPWMPRVRGLSLGTAGVVIVAAASLPWTGTGFGGWLLPDPLAIHVVVLTGFAWVMASVEEEPSALVAALVGLVNLALLSDGAGVTAVATGFAGMVAVFCLRLEAPGPTLQAAAIGAALAMFGLVVLYVATVPALGPGWAALSWSALPETGQRANGMALSTGFVLTLLGLGVSCGLAPFRASLCGEAMPRSLTMLAGPLGGVWLVVALRLRGVLDGNGHAIAPGGVLLAIGLAGLGFAAWRLWRSADLVSAPLVAVFGAALVGFGVGSVAATAAGLLYLTLGCVALTAAAAGSRLGLAALAGLPPLGVFASGFALVAVAALRNGIVAGLLGVGLFAVAAAVLRRLPQASPPARLGWVGVALTLVGSWAMPPAITAWIQGIAAAAR